MSIDAAGQKKSKHKNIILIGFMGTGKTVVGRNLARTLNFDFVDSDEEIEKVTGQPLPQLIKKHGELRFRSEERLLFDKLAQKEHQIVATGGSIQMNSDNLLRLKPDGFFVLLQSDPEILYQRISRKNHRTIQGKKPSEEQIRELLQKNTSLYEKLADFCANTSQMTVDEVTNIIIKAWQSGGQKPEDRGKNS
ncbi:MAG: AAA family ATPase [Clostridiales bacterium]|nr:AAA family ATPase [Clostridiales bacterium]